MFQLVVPDLEIFDEGKSEFLVIKGQNIQVEHSLVSISKWESKWNKPFLSKQAKTIEETIDYIRCMTISQNVRPEVYNNITNDNISKISEYIAAPMTATWFNDDSKNTSREVITSEVIYYWMIAYNIPFECQKWHLNRLLTLIRVCSKKNEKPKKMSRAEIANRNRSLNEQRRQQLKSNG
jgi:hypothetical protein